MKQLDHLEVILKTVERCNLNCSYCYFFHGEDQSYKKHPPFISWETIEKVTQFLLEGIEQFQIKKLVIDLHGGEPTLQKKAAFDKMCHYFRDQLGGLTNLTLNIQTNATLIDEEWIHLFSKHRVFVGVSIDGPKTIHDRFRLDHKGLGTYDKTIAGIRKLQAAYQDKKIESVGALSVINPNYDAKELYRHLIHELNFERIDYLLPDHTHHNFGSQNPDDYGRFFLDLLNAWIIDDNPRIHVRILSSALSMLLGGQTYLKGFGPTSHTIEAITISSNGDLSPDDTLRSGIPHLMNKSNIASTTLAAFFATPQMQEVIKASQASPDACKSCCWENVCGGNALISRYSHENGFNNPSVYCSGLKTFYAAVTRYLVENGISTDQIKKVLLPAKS